MEAFRMYKALRESFLPSVLNPSMDAFVRVGFEIGQKDEDLGLTQMKLPENWQIYAEKGGNYIVDANNSKRVVMYLYQSNPSMSLLTRYMIWTTRAVDGKERATLFDRGNEKFLWVSEPVIIGSMEEYRATQEGKKILNNKFPLWNDPLMYW